MKKTNQQPIHRAAFVYKFFLLFLALSAGISACANMEVESATLDSEPAAAVTATAPALTPLDIAVNQYFSDDVSRANDAAGFLNDVGFDDVSVKIADGLVAIQFEQFNDLLPADMQARYILAFQVAERFSPLCQQVELTVLVEEEAFITLSANCADIRLLRKNDKTPQQFLNDLEKEVLDKAD